MPLSVIKFDKITDNLTLNFDLGDLKHFQVICPNPAVADSFRVSLKKIEKDNVVESTTIAKFLSDLFTKSFGDKKVTRKSELLKILGTVWKIRFEGQDPSLFHQAFELFTDLRSFTLDKSMMDTVLEHYHPIVNESVKTFWLVLENQEIIDEHQAYHDLYHHCLENPDVLSDEELGGFLFSGFSHLSANQIEFIKLLGKFTDVFIPIPVEVIDNSLSTDWVDWVLSQADRVVDCTSDTTRREVPSLSFSRGRLNTALKEIKDESFDQIIFPKKSISFTESLKSYSKDFFFKSQSEDLNHYLNLLRDEITHKYVLNTDEKVAVEELKEFLMIKFEGRRLDSIKEFCEFKIVSCLLETLEDYKELSENNLELSDFDFSLIWEVVQLNLPRIFNIPLLWESKGQLISLKELYQVSASDKSLIIVSSDHDLKVGGVSNYSREVQEILVTLGPIRRQGLDFLYYIYHLRELLSFPHNEVFLEEGLLEHDQAWANVFKGISLKEKEPSRYLDGESSVKSKEPVASEVSYDPPLKLSASRMQTALECPQKYFYSYVLKLGQEPEKQKNVDPRALGETEHEIVQDYLKQKSDWDELFFTELVDKKVKKFFSEELLGNILLNEEIYSEVTFFGKQTINEFLKLKKIDPDIRFKFEEKINDTQGTGAADVLVESNILGRMLFDLKRSSGSIPDKYKILSLKTIQLWYYQFFFKGKEQPFNCFGYINLSDPESSVVFVNDHSVLETLKEIDFFELNSFEKIKEDYTFYLDNFKEKFDNTRELIQEHINYPVNPIDSSVCTFCPGASICSRGQDHG